MASAQRFQRPRASLEMITLNYACISHNSLQALSPFSSLLKPETSLPDGYDYPQFVDEGMKVQRGEPTNPKS